MRVHKRRREAFLEEYRHGKERKRECNMEIDAIAAARVLIDALNDNEIEPCIICAYGLECGLPEVTHDCVEGVMLFLAEQAEH